jgi:hypothetical protein
LSTDDGLERRPLWRLKVGVGLSTDDGLERRPLWRLKVGVGVPMLVNR